MSEIINKWWFSSYRGLIGIVKVKDDLGNEKFYIDVAPGRNEELDAKGIATWGAKFYPEQIK